MKAAMFRGATFHMETGARASGRRVVVHTYPKRNDPYSEDMGRTPIAFHVTGYCIGPNYLQQRDALIGALEADGPGELQMPWPYAGQNLQVMAGNYTMTESRERGGYCTFEMEFTEPGKAGFSGVGPTAQSQTLGAASTVQQSAADYNATVVGSTPSPTEVNQMWDASVGRVPADVTDTQPM
jgi:prophage DNA circulation protein